MAEIEMRIDKGFRPMYLFVEEYKKRLSEVVAPSRFEFALERDGGFVVSTSADVLPAGVDDELNFKYCERLIKSVLWTVGGFKLSIFADKPLFLRIKQAYSKGGARDFDVNFFEKVYGVPFTVEYCEKVPAAVCEFLPVGNGDKGARIGLDAGGSDIKIAAVLDGKVLYSDEIVWQPKIQENPEYHVAEINGALKKAASYLPRVDAVGVSSAGIFVNNETRVASLFIKVADKDYAKIKTIYTDAAKNIGAPVTVENDGDVAAIAGALEYGLANLLGVAMGTSEAAGFIDGERKLWGWLNELAFVPVDANDDAEIDEWSGDIGVGVKYLSQDGVIKLAEKAGITFENAKSPAEKLKIVQKLVESGDKNAENVFYDVGAYLAYSLLYYRGFYGFDNVLLMGRVVSGRGGEIILKRADEILREYGTDGLPAFKLLLPDERSRRVGQAVAAASL